MLRICNDFWEICFVLFILGGMSLEGGFVGELVCFEGHRISPEWQRMPHEWFDHIFELWEVSRERYSKWYGTVSSESEL